MICKKYSAQYKIEKVKEYLEEYSKTKIAKATFAAKNGISDSTFNDWVLKYQRNKVGFCNITNEIVKLNDIESVETEQKLVKQITSINQNIKEEDYIKLYYNGVAIEFNKSILEKVMEIIKEW